MGAIKLSDKFDFKKIIRFTVPSIISMILTSVYGIVDGFFISNFAGQSAFAAVNLILPFITIISPIGFMFGTGGSAIIGRHLGMGKKKKANGIFSMLIYVLIALGIVISILGFIFTEQVALILGATEGMLPDCVVYCRISMLGLTFFMLQYAFQILLVTAEKPKIALVVTIAAGATNVVLDAVFVGCMGMGAAGAAWATIASEILAGSVPIIYFLVSKKAELKFTRLKWDGHAFFVACSNGASELMTTISSSVMAIIYNFQLMSAVGDMGVAAYGVIMYTNLIFIGVYMGFSVGIAPVISYKYGEGNNKELRYLYRTCMKIIWGASIIMTVIGEIAAGGIAYIFVGYNADLFNMTVTGLRIYMICFLFMGFNTFASSLFTALNNGLISALISFGRTFIFQLISVLLLPLLFGLTGIWSASIAAEIMGAGLSLLCIIKNKKKYNLQ